MERKDVLTQQLNGSYDWKKERTRNDQKFRCQIRSISVQLSPNDTQCASDRDGV